MRHYLSALIAVAMLCGVVIAQHSVAQENQEEATLSKLQGDLFTLEELVSRLVGQQEELQHNLSLLQEDMAELSEKLQNQGNDDTRGDNSNNDAINEALLQRLSLLEEQLEKSSQESSLGNRLELLESENIAERLRQLEANIKQTQPEVQATADNDTSNDTTTAEETAEPATSSAGAAETAATEEAIQAAYREAFSRLAERHYEVAEVSFKEFVANYPNHPLTANAVYWIGESYYVRGDYRTAAQQFLTSYNDYPTGGKRHDSLLKLGLSLKALELDKEACKALGELLSVAQNGGGVSDNIRDRAEKERGTLSCP